MLASHVLSYSLFKAKPEPHMMSPLGLSLVLKLYPSKISPLNSKSGTPQDNKTSDPLRGLTIEALLVPYLFMTSQEDKPSLMSKIGSIKSK